MHATTPSGKPLATKWLAQAWQRIRRRPHITPMPLQAAMQQPLLARGITGYAMHLRRTAGKINPRTKTARHA
jgi:hypothetical protein